MQLSLADRVKGRSVFEGKRRWRVCGVLGVIGTAGVAGACTSSLPPGAAAGLEVVIETDLQDPAQYDAFRVQVSQESAPGTFDALFDNAYRVPAEGKLPTRVAIAPGSSADQDALIKVTAYHGYVGATQRGTEVVVRVAQIQIPTTRVAELTLELSSSCIGGVTCSDSNQSCQPSRGTSKGKCASSVVNEVSLPPYEPGGADGIDGGNAGDVNAPGAGRG